jgi:hypothetical protein
MPDPILNLPPPPAAPLAPLVPSAAPPAAALPDTPPPIFSEGTTFSDKWRETLDEDMRADPSLENVTNLNSLVKSYLSGQKMIGMDKIALPTENSTPDQWGEFFNKTGRPKEASQYDFTKVEVDESIKMTDEEMSGMQTKIHELGLNNTQAAGVYDYYNQTIMSGLESQKLTEQKNYDDGMTELKAQQGHKFQEFMDGANKVVQTFDKDGDIARLGLESSPYLARLLGSIAAGISEDKLIGSTGGTGAMTPNDAQMAINKIYENPGFFSKSHPDHEALVHEVQRLTQSVYPSSMYPE